MKFLKNISLILLSSFFIASCSVDVPETRKYEEYSQFSFNDVTTMYNLESGHYYVHFYSESCPHCEKVKPHLFNYLDKLANNTASTKVYIFNAHSSSSDIGRGVRMNFKEHSEDATVESLIAEMNENKPTTVGQTYWISIPSLYEVNEGKFASFTAGRKDLTEFYKNLK